MLISFLPLYGKDLGLSEVSALHLIVVFGIGGIVGQVPIGWLADRVDRMLLATICTFLVFATSLVMPFVISIQPWNLIYMLVLGAVLGGVYTIALVIIGQQFKGADLAAASALFGVMWGAGTVFGPQLGGLAYEHLPPHGLPLTLAVVTVMLLPFPAAAWRRRSARR
jgi:MFS family permease